VVSLQGERGSEATDSITQEPENYFSSLKGEVAIKINPTIPIVILADKGRISNIIRIAPINAKIIPIINCILLIFFVIDVIKDSIFIRLSILRAPSNIAHNRDYV